MRPRTRGTTTKFDMERGYGFVLPDGSRKTAFIHVNDLEDKLMLKKGDRVEFEIVETRDGQRAVFVKLLMSDGGAL